MNTLKNSSFRLAAFFILMGLVSRFIPHPPNFTAMNSLALLGTVYFGSPGRAFALVCGTMWLSDAVLGFHSSQAYVYCSYFLMCCLGRSISKRISIRSLCAMSTASSLLFFLITNFGDWATTSMYPHTLYGLGLCYLAGIPFLGNQIAGTLLYSILLSLPLFFVKRKQPGGDCLPAFRG